MSGCTATIENDGTTFGGNGDRWYTGGWRLQRDIAAEPDDPDRPWVDAVAADAATWLDVLPDGDGSAPFTTVSLVVGQQIYTPENIETTAVVENDRPYAGWLYTGLARYDTWLDPDAAVRRDVEHMVELDVGIVGPASMAEQVQDATHDVLNEEKAHGWDNQLDNEFGVVLRAARSSRDGYAPSLFGGPLSWDLISCWSGALGNVDTHAGGGALLRFGFALPRSFDVQSGDRRLLQPGASFDQPASFYCFAGVDGRLVLQNIFLDGNSFHSSHHVDKEPLVGALRLGVSYESGGFRIAYTCNYLTDEFEGQPAGEIYGSVTVGWSQHF
jgi:lipid A 3-O-deacylase